MKRFLIIENAEDVCLGLIERMRPFTEWESIGYCMGIRHAIRTVAEQKPDLIFLDWSLNGGSAYEVLQFIESLQDYEPFIIFNTGFQKDNPEIPEEILNKYRVDKYLIKPYWEKLRTNLPQYLEEARMKAERIPSNRRRNQHVWLRLKDGELISADLQLLQCVIHSPAEPRYKEYYLAGRPAPLLVQHTWQECIALLSRCNIDFFQTNARVSLLTRSFVEKYDRPMVHIRGFKLRVEVTREALKDFEDWLDPKMTSAKGLAS